MDEVKVSRVARRLLTLLAGCGFILGAALAQERADLAVRNAKILTLDPQSRVAQAVAIRGGKFAAVGSDSEIQKWIGPQTRVIDAAGKTVIPGLIESHSHASSVAAAEAVVPYEEMTSIAVIQDWVRRAAARKPAGEWIVIPRSYPTRLKERRFPTRAELDAAASRHPVVFDGAYSHVLNSLALEKAQITRSSPPLKVGEIVRDARGEPTGLLRNARGVLGKLLPNPKVAQADVLKHLLEILGVYSSLGITSVVERGAGLDDYRLYEALRSQGKLRLRTRVTLRLSGSTAAEPNPSFDRFPSSPAEGTIGLAQAL